MAIAYRSRFRPNRLQLVMHHVLKYLMLAFFAVNSCVLVAVLGDPLIKSEFLGAEDKLITIAFLVCMVAISGILSYKEYSKLYHFYQDKRKREHHEFY